MSITATSGRRGAQPLEALQTVTRPRHVEARVTEMHRHDARDDGVVVDQQDRGHRD
jgi:hypothetical protein